mmetsp:Transcript_8704/g.23981  ORF Transcript_8704/g.23981 Transcript_8704/m.23981 type:complete len:259 (+) Transcript_8704:569-1345(+)
MARAPWDVPPLPASRGGILLAHAARLKRAPARGVHNAPLALPAHERAVLLHAHVVIGVPWCPQGLGANAVRRLPLIPVLCRAIVAVALAEAYPHAAAVVRGIAAVHAAPAQLLEPLARCLGGCTGHVRLLCILALDRAVEPIHVLREHLEARAVLQAQLLGTLSPTVLAPHFFVLTIILVLVLVLVLVCPCSRLEWGRSGRRGGSRRVFSTVHGDAAHARRAHRAGHIEPALRPLPAHERAVLVPLVRWLAVPPAQVV